MPWPTWLSSTSSASSETSSSAPPSQTPDPTDWRSYTSPQTLLTSTVLTGSTLFLYRLYRRHLTRIPSAPLIPQYYLRTRSIYGYVTSVGDGDNFRLYHTPGGALAGWGWLPSRRVTTLSKKDLKDRTIHVRIAGVDAPELAHFGKPGQPFGEEALEFLKGLLTGKYVRAYVWRKDQYERVVASVYFRTWWGGRRDVGLEMLRKGWATVYEAKFGSEFGGKEEVYRKAEEVAKRKGVGMWGGRRAEAGWFRRMLVMVSGPIKDEEKGQLESPRAFKDRIKKEEAVVATATKTKK